MACKDEHCGNDWTPYAKPQPDTGQFWGKIHEFEQGQQPHVKVGYVFVPCQHCNDAPCVAICPNGALYVDDNGLVQLNARTCSGCQSCMDKCPYGLIFYNKDLQIAQKCTGCVHLLAKGWTEPRCVDQCPQECLTFGEESALDIAGAETWMPDYGLDTKVYYFNLPKKFIAGIAYDPTTKEVVIGATCTLSGTASASTTTNDYGEFWFENLTEGVYTLSISGDGKSYSTSVDITEEAKSVGDVALS